MASPFAIRDGAGKLRRYIVIQYPRSYVVWDRHECRAASGFLRSLDRAVAQMETFNA
jgi:hypothetical protein